VWFRSAIAGGGLAAGRYERGTVTDAPTLVFARRVSPEREANVLFAALNLDWLGESALDAQLLPDSSVNIVDDDGVVLARSPRHAEWVGRNVRDVPIVTAALAATTGAMEARGLDDEVRVFGYHRVPMSESSGLTVIVGFPLAAAYAAANERLRYNLLVLAIVAGVTLVVARQAGDRLFTRRIEALLRAARRLSAGDLSATTGQAWTSDELGELSRTFDSMAWTVSQRTEDLRQMMESLRALAARAEHVREEERTRISREIHDELGQTLTGIRMDLDRLEERVAKANLTAAEREAVNAKIASIRELAASGLDVARRISRQLRPSVLDVLGVAAAIEWQLEEFQARTGIATTLLAEDDLSALDDQASTALFRILQEALTNIMRHAAATEVTARIARDPDAVVMEVTDNGRGFDAADAPFPKSLGLLGMRERAALLGGVTSVTSQQGRGTTVHVRLPVRQTSSPAPV
jgi:signal transduction histidine kinase